MALAHYPFIVQDVSGNIVDGATITVNIEGTGALAVPYSDELAATPLGNPFVAASGADAGFYITGGKYRIRAVLGSVSRDLRNILIGTAQGVDAPVGGIVTRTVTAAGDITVTATDGCIEVNKTVGAATNVIMGTAAARGGADIEIYDRKGDAATNNITPVFSGAETCMGLTGASFAITTNNGRVKFSPLADGTGWRLNDNAL